MKRLLKVRKIWYALILYCNSNGLLTRKFVIVKQYCNQEDDTKIQFPFQNIDRAKVENVHGNIVRLLPPYDPNMSVHSQVQI